MFPSKANPVVLPVQKFNNIIEGTANINADDLVVRLSVYKESMVISWRWEGELHTQVLERVKFKSSMWVKCPRCERKTWRLFLTNGAGNFLCRSCAGPDGYPYWSEPGQTRQPKSPGSWYKWFTKKSNKIMGGMRNGKG
jgi:phage FluMu protein Com